MAANASRRVEHKKVKVAEHSGCSTAHGDLLRYSSQPWSVLVNTYPPDWSPY